MAAVSPVADLRLPAAIADRVNRLPEGSISIETNGAYWVLRASRPLQSRFEGLLERRKAGSQTEEESRDYEAICELDTVLSELNRLVRRVQQS